jgi:hypothetical protein
MLENLANAECFLFPTLVLWRRGLVIVKQRLLFVYFASASFYVCVQS